ncbi:MAG: type II toxin-antitoxin system PemK/MazF family toxin [Patescibacteria group bacterium]
MGKFAVGSIVLVTFPFSDLKGQKVRPALVLANVEFNNLILCQITSKPYSSKISIRLTSTDFATGGLPIVSYVRPDKLFTADTTIIKKTVGKLSSKTTDKVLKNIRALFKSS